MRVQVGVVVCLVAGRDSGNSLVPPHLLNLAKFPFFHTALSPRHKETFPYSIDHAAKLLSLSSCVFETFYTRQTSAQSIPHRGDGDANLFGLRTTRPDTDAGLLCDKPT